MTKKRSVALLLLLIVSAACTHDDQPDAPGMSDTRERLDRWLATEPSSYVWTIEAHAAIFGVRVSRIFVEQGVPVRAFRAGEKLEIEGREVDNFPATVERLFEFIVQYESAADSFEVAWSDDGYPARVTIGSSSAPHLYR